MGQAVRKRKPLPVRKQSVTRRQPQKPADVSFTREAISLGLFVCGVFVAVSLWSHYNSASLEPGENVMGIVGALVAAILTKLLGWCSYAVVVGLVLMARRVWQGVEDSSITVWSSLLAALGSLIMVSAAAAFVSVLLGAEGGGAIGAHTAFVLVRYVSEAGTLLLTLAVFFLALSLSTGVGTAAVLAGLSAAWSFLGAIAVDTVYFCRELCRGAVVLLVKLGRIGVTAGAAAGAALLRMGSSVGGWMVDFWLERKEQRMREASELKSVEVKTPTKPRSKPNKADDNWTLGEDLDTTSTRSSRTQPSSSSAEAPPIRVLRQDIKVEKTTSSKKSDLGRKRAKAVPEAKSAGKPKRRYDLPPLELLVKGDPSSAHAPDDKTLISNSKRLEKALADFRVGGNVVEVQPGPVITLYQFLPAAGVKVQRIISLADDLALTLRVASVRVYAPVPGKGTVGIEVPNDNREMVRLHDVLASEEIQQTKSDLMVAIGKDTFGNPYAANLARMPHLLIAGATGTGKSVFINSLLLSLLYRNTPEDLNFIMIDPKMLELSIYEGIPHLKAPVVTNPKRARGVLWWAVEEMERRYKLMKDLGVRNLASYNNLARGDDGESRKKFKNGETVIELRDRDIVTTGANSTPLTGVDDNHDDVKTPSPGAKQLEVLPRIVIVVDELADLMLTVGREIEELFTRLAQKARAAGIHLVLATQRPSVNVITGLIKANFPARVSFKVASRIDSRTVLDDSGAERLLGDGDLLYMSPNTRGVVRLHGAFVSDSEVTEVVAALKDQGPPEYDEAIEKMIDAIEKGDGGSASGAGGDEEYDPLYDEAVALVVEKGSASTSMVQRAFRIGYNRAARILETMERDGVVGPADGSRPRQILAPNHEMLAD
ncbi:MAG: DNA translocase FtsK 4TM domain-containing protein [Bdellovibrionales bacterium]|nr:DNA translocase FtsK 4TM domain-containing protein [Bdellovibrionales bacterium]